MKLGKHEIILHGEKVTLRPMTEDDWDILLKWNSDPDVLYFAEGDEVSVYTLEQTQQIYRGISQNAVYHSFTTPQLPSQPAVSRP